MKRLVVLAMITYLISGCTETEKFWDKEFVQVYAPAKVREKDRVRTGESLDFFLGKSKDERIRIIGPPTGCARLNTGEEICEWSPKAANALEQHVAYTFDRDGIARGWSYRGPLGQFTHDNYLAGEKAIAGSQAAQPAQKRWSNSVTGASESSAEFSRDYFACQTKVAQDPKAAQNMAMYEEYHIEDCMKTTGWVHK